MKYGDGMNYIPQRGDVVWLTFNPQAGHEQAGRRPALILSPGIYNGKVGLCLACPVTSHIKGYPFEVLIPSGLKISGVILSDQLKSLDWRARSVEFIDKLPSQSMYEVFSKIGVLFADE